MKSWKWCMFKCASYLHIEIYIYFYIHRLIHTYIYYLYIHIICVHFGACESACIHRICFFESALPWIYILLHIIGFWSWNKYPRHASALRKMCQKKQEHMIGITYGMLPSRTIAVSTLGQKKADASRRRNKIPVYNWRLIWKVTPFTFLLCHSVWYLWYPFKFRVFSCIPMRIFYLNFFHFSIVDMLLHPWSTSISFRFWTCQLFVGHVYVFPGMLFQGVKLM